MLYVSDSINASSFSASQVRMSCARVPSCAPASTNRTGPSMLPSHSANRHASSWPNAAPTLTLASVSVGAAFGQLLACRFAEWLGSIDGPVRLVEAGAHDGTLAHDILTWLAENDEALLESLTYKIVEPSARRRAWQTKRLAKFEQKVEWVDSIAALPEIRESPATRRSNRPTRLSVQTWPNASSAKPAALPMVQRFCTSATPATPHRFRPAK